MAPTFVSLKNDEGRAGKSLVDPLRDFHWYFRHASTTEGLRGSYQRAGGARGEQLWPVVTVTKYGTFDTDPRNFRIAG